MAVKSLAVVFACVLFAWFAASAAVIWSTREASKQRQALITFVCASIEVAEANPSMESLERVARFREILDSIGESCNGK